MPKILEDAVRQIKQERATRASQRLCHRNERPAEKRESQEGA